MSVASYLTVGRDGTAEIEVARSRFLCTVGRAVDEMGARGLIDQVRREHWNARHHCFAYILGPDRAIEQSSDAGEPSGTAGAPMLAVLRGQQLSDTVVVVSRWFGGTLLGTGGLARAYAEATRTGLAEVGRSERVLQELCEVEVDIAAVGRLEHELRARGARMLGVEYTGEALLRFAIPLRARAVTEEMVAELTEGATSLRVIGQRWVDSPV